MESLVLGSRLAVDWCLGKSLAESQVRRTRVPRRCVQIGQSGLDTINASPLSQNQVEAAVLRKSK